MKDFKIIGILILNFVLLVLGFIVIPFYFGLVKEFTYFVILACFILLIQKGGNE